MGYFSSTLQFQARTVQLDFLVHFPLSLFRFWLGIVCALYGIACALPEKTLGPKRPSNGFRDGVGLGLLFARTHLP